MSSKAFNHQIFCWLHQINHDKRLLAIDLCVAVELTRYFDEKDQGGCAWPKCKTVSDAIGLHETTILRSVRRLEITGHLRAIWGRQGRGHSSQYWMILKPAEPQVLKPAVRQQKKPAAVQEFLKKLLRRRLKPPPPEMGESANLRFEIPPVRGGPLRGRPNLLKNPRSTSRPSPAEPPQEVRRGVEQNAGNAPNLRPTACMRHGGRWSSSGRFARGR